MLDVAAIPSHPELEDAFRAAAQQEQASEALLNVYTTGVMYEADGVRAELDASSMGLNEGLVMWHLAREFKPEVMVETGFGRGGSAAFFLSAMAPWGGRLISIDPAFRQWTGEAGITYIRELGLAPRHQIIETPSEFALPSLIRGGQLTTLPLSYVDGSHHFDGTLFDFMFMDKLTPVGGIIAIDDAHAPAVRTVASFVATNLPYKLHYATARLVLCQKTAPLEREWDHFRPFVSSTLSDWNVHIEPATPLEVPAATFR